MLSSPNTQKPEFCSRAQCSEIAPCHNKLGLSLNFLQDTHHLYGGVWIINWLCCNRSRLVLLLPLLILLSSLVPICFKTLHLCISVLNLTLLVSFKAYGFHLQLAFTQSFLPCKFHLFPQPQSPAADSIGQVESLLNNNSVFDNNPHVKC